jgi:hypothetical protein
MRVIDQNGAVLDAEFSVESYSDTQTIVLESAGGPGSRPARDYREALGLLLIRLAAIGAILTDGAVDSRVARALPYNQRRLVLRHGRKYPINLRSVDLDDLRRAIGAAQEHVGQKPGATSGNRTKRIRLIIEPSSSSFPHDLETYLSTGRVDSPLGGMTCRPAVARHGEVTRRVRAGWDCRSASHSRQTPGVG